MAEKTSKKSLFDKVKAVANEGENLAAETLSKIKEGASPKSGGNSDSNYDDIKLSKENAEPESQENFSGEPQREDENIAGQNEESSDKETAAYTVINTNADAKDGQVKCPKCGATDISVNKNTGKLRCNFCRHEFEQEKASGIEDDLEKLTGIRIGTGATDIVADAEHMITLKCQSCGAEVVINTEEQYQSRCHWCRNTLSINQQIPNGTIPDIVLPFAIKKEDAEAEVRKFIEARKFFANSKFKREFTTENIIGVYLPYMVVDINGHATLKGQGEHLVRKYRVTSGDDDEETLYDADLYNVEREFDITISDLTVESSDDKIDYKKKGTTNNIINSILPFDTENATKWDANYLKGYNSEKRNMNMEGLTTIVEKQAKSVVRHKANETAEHYDRGIRWDEEKLEMKGQQWVAAYLPVWLYSYQEKKGSKSLLHYTAVNARTKETMGSVPVNMSKLIGISAIIEVVAVLLAALLYLFIEEGAVVALLITGPIFALYMYKKYRNKDVRHTYEKETDSDFKNIRKVDDFVKHMKGLSDEKMKGANNQDVHK